MSLVLLDRDGVINVDTPKGITSPDQLQLIDGSAQAIARLNKAGIKVAVITNQSVVGKGLISEAQLHDIHDYLMVLLAQHGAQLDGLYWCADHPDSPTNRRKPNAGMLLEALSNFGAEPAQTPMLGDALRDLQAAQTAGCPAHLVRTGKGQKTEQSVQAEGLSNVQTHDDLAAFVTYWLHQKPKQA